MGPTIKYIIVHPHDMVTNILKVVYLLSIIERGKERAIGF